MCIRDRQVNAVSIGSLLYTTAGHFDSDACSFDHRIHDFKIAIPVADRRLPCDHYDSIPAFRGVSTPVSYTHLDVYKRQAIPSAPTP